MEANLPRPRSSRLASSTGPPDDTVSRLAAMSDRSVSRALNLIHTRYGEPLSIEMLCCEAGLSKTVLRERFLKLLGQSPMRYCTQWRLRMASAMLGDRHRKTADIAFSVGFSSEAAFNRAFKRLYGEPPATWSKRRRAGGPEDLPKQQVHYCAARDGTRLAWSAVGAGFPLVKTANWLNHLDFDWQSPVWRHWLRELTRENCLVRYDERGNGMSDWDTPELSFEAFVDDLETVIDAAGLDQFDLLALSQGAAVAIAYSLRHPGRIRRMILLGGYARGWALRLNADELARREAMVTLTQTGWGSDNPAYRQMFTSLYIPGGTPEQLGWWNELQRVSTSPENAVRLQRVLSTVDVTALLGQVTVPTLVVHAWKDQVIPFEAGRQLAQGIPGSKFLILDSQNHVLLEHEPAWQEFLKISRDFLRSERHA
jgi:pimeloyl-ACP methyl ester carboxylesterase/AraC-like DNA-binding protein